MNRQELESFEEKALKQFKSGKSFFGKAGSFASLLKSFIEKVLVTEMEKHS